LDLKVIINTVSKTGCIATVEWHINIVGLDESVAKVLGFYKPTPQEIEGTNYTFGKFGAP
jgi:transketolase C-terminal domain/subunit